MHGNEDETETMGMTMGSDSTHDSIGRTFVDMYSLSCFKGVKV
jgi:hypothetical protein